MIKSLQSAFSDGQLVTASAASTNFYDLGAQGTPPGGSAVLNRDMGKGHEVPLRVQVVEDFDNLTSLKVAVQQSSDEAFSSPETVLETEAIPLASLVAGYVFNIDELPLHTTERYVRLYYTVAGTAPSVGRIDAWLAWDEQTAPL